MFGYTFTSNPEKIAMKAEQQIQNELGISDTIPYEIEKGVPGLRYVLHCKIPGSREVTISFSVQRTNLFYTSFFVLNFTTDLPCQVLGRISYGFAQNRESKNKTPGDEFPNVEGDTGTKEKLKKADVLQRLIEFCSSYVEYGTMRIRTNPTFEIVPLTGGSQLRLSTLLGKKKSKIISGAETSIRIKEFIELADDVERALSNSNDQTRSFEKPNYSVETELDINS